MSASHLRLQYLNIAHHHGKCPLRHQGISSHHDHHAQLIMPVTKHSIISSKCKNSLCHQRLSPPTKCSLLKTSFFVLISSSSKCSLCHQRVTDLHRHEGRVEEVNEPGETRNLLYVKAGLGVGLEKLLSTSL